MLWAQPVATEAGQPGQNSYAPGALEPPKVYPYAFYLILNILIPVSNYVRAPPFFTQSIIIAIHLYSIADRLMMSTGTYMLAVTCYHTQAC